MRRKKGNAPVQRARMSSPYRDLYNNNNNNTYVRRRTNASQKRTRAPITVRQRPLVSDTYSRSNPYGTAAAGESERLRRVLRARALSAAVSCVWEPPRLLPASSSSFFYFFFLLPGRRLRLLLSRRAVRVG